ncbi:MAG: hypothetical protein ACP5ML_04930, partial [Fervidicoccus sp.]
HIVKESTRPILQKTKETLNRTPQTKREPITHSKNHTPHKTRLHTHIHMRKRSRKNTQTKTSKNDTKNRESG